MTEWQKRIDKLLTDGSHYVGDSACTTCGNSGSVYRLALELFRMEPEPNTGIGILDHGCAFCREEWSGVALNHPRHRPDCPWEALRRALGLADDQPGAVPENRS